MDLVNPMRRRAELLARNDEIRREARQMKTAELELRLQHARKARYDAETELQALRHEVEVLEGVAAERGVPLVWVVRK
jgi:hypothetical protein